MTDIELVIRIDKEEYNDVKYCGTIFDEDREYIVDAIKNGTPLPKGHGDLIDRQELIEFADSDYEDGEYHAVSISEIKYAKAIIKADKGE